MNLDLRDVDLLCLDAGNCIVFFDHARVARIASEAGHPVDAASLERAEAHAKIAQETGEVVRVAWEHEHLPGARGWGEVLATMLLRAGLPERALANVLELLWREHLEKNTYSIVPRGFAEAMQRARRAGVKVVVVSNAEGKLAAFFEQLGIASCFDHVVDSGIVGVAKPDPRIFDFALDFAGVAAENALMLGDTYATDIVGARAAGIRAALIDPLGHLAGRHPDVPRVAGAVEVANALATLPRARR